MTAPENPFFARTIVNRLWAHYFGRGLVEPIDDMRATNPASNPELLDALGDHLVEIKFDLRRLMRSIMRSRVYQLSSTSLPENADDRRFYPHYNIKRLPAEVLLDAIDVACGTHEPFGGVPLGTRAIELPDPNFNSYFLDTLGRPQRAIACECERTAGQCVRGERGSRLPVHPKRTDRSSLPKLQRNLWGVWAEKSIF